MAGTAYVTAQGGGWCYSTADASTHDTFTLIGPASSPPITFGARLVVSFFCSQLAHSLATFQEGAGFSVVSCQGFTTSQPVPVRQTTWGALKAIYR